MELIKETGIDVAGKDCVVIGRSNIVGKPMAALLTQADGTVTLCHSKTPDLADITRQADILVSAVGKVNCVTVDMVKDGAVVIDVAMNRNEAGKLCGDVDYAAAAERACKEVQQETPLGAYAVEYLTYTIDDSARNYTAIHLTIGYRRTQEQIASMVYTTSVSALGELLTAAARSGSGELVVQVGYFDHQEDQVRSIVDQVQAMEAPEQKEPWTVNFYPEGGDVGIIEILLKKS